MSEIVLYEVRDRRAFITLNRPDKRNALSDKMVAALKLSFNKALDDNSVKVIILKANGNAFCAGADLKYLEQLQNNSFEENLEDSRSLADLFQLIYKASKVVIAQISGPAIAGGCGLATICDFSIASPESTFGYSEVKIGFIPAIVMVYLVNKIGEGKARDILLSGRFFDADEAVNLGLINRVVADDQLENEVEKLANSLAEKCSGQSMALVKEMLSELSGRTIDSSIDYASEMNAKARATEDCKKGISSFLNKERISWK